MTFFIFEYNIITVFIITTLCAYSIMYMYLYMSQFILHLYTI